MLAKKKRSVLDADTKLREVIHETVDELAMDERNLWNETQTRFTNERWFAPDAYLESTGTIPDAIEEDLIIPRRRSYKQLLVTPGLIKRSRIRTLVTSGLIKRSHTRSRSPDIVVAVPT